MAVGDPVISFGAGVRTFQPAAGANVMILSYWGAHNALQSPRVYDGTNESYNDLGSTSTPQNNIYSGQNNIKMIINNTNYIRGGTAGLYSAFTGIEI